MTKKSLNSIKSDKRIINTKDGNSKINRDLRNLKSDEKLIKNDEPKRIIKHKRLIG